MARAKKEKLSLEELLEQALVKEEDQPYEVPSNWVWTKLGDIIRVSSGKSLTAKKMALDGGIPVYGGNGVTGYHNDFNVDKPTIVIGRVGFYCGSIHFINEKAWVTDNALIVSFQEDKVDIKFVYWLLSNINLRENDSSTAQPVISGSKIYSLALPLPPLAEQQRIVERIESLFEKLDTAKELAQNALDSFENRKAAILYKAFTGELTAKWREENGVSLDSWEDVTLGQLTKIVGGGTPSSTILEYYEGGKIPWITPADLSNYKGKYIAHGKRNITELGLQKSSAQLMPKGTVLLSSRAPIGYVAISTNDVSTNQGFKSFLPNERYIPEFLYYYFKFMGKKLEDYASGTTFLELSAKRVSEIPFRLPRVDEQKQIIGVLDKVFINEQQAQELCDVIEKIDLMKKAILARAFRGELGTNNPEEESAIELLKEVLKEKL
nr:restriction endonuclease subunit S [uncultured Niameybacter sp.]